MKIRIEKAQRAGDARRHAAAAPLRPLDDDGSIAMEGLDVPPGGENLARKGAHARPERLIFTPESEGQPLVAPCAPGLSLASLMLPL